MFFNTKNNKNALILTLFITTSSLTISAQANKPSNRIHNPGTHFYLNDDPAPLHSAVQASDLKALQLLLKHGIDPDTEDKNGNTPLMVASALGKIEMIDLLLKHGADPASRNKKGQTFIPATLEKDHPTIEILKILDSPKIRSFIGTLPIEERTEYLQILTTRAFADTTIDPLIIWFEEQFGLSQPNLLSTNFDDLDPWRLKNLWTQENLETVQAYMREKAWIGIVTDQGVSYDSIIKATRIYQEEHLETQFAYVTKEMADTIGLDHFSGLIFPGGGDNYPAHLDTFTLEDMPEHEQTEKEKVYQYLYEQALATDIPTLGICAGAQHLVLHRGGALTHNKTHTKKVKFTSHHVPHFLSLTLEERQKLLETCYAEDFSINIFRAHKYSAVTETVLAAGLTLAMEDGITPLTFYEGFQTIAIQFHPEARYRGVNRYGDAHSVTRQTNLLLNGFFSLCENHKAWIDWAKREGYTREEAITLRKASLEKILDRLEECRENPEPEPITWEDSVTFEFQEHKTA